MLVAVPERVQLNEESRRNIVLKSERSLHVIVLSLKDIIYDKAADGRGNEQTLTPCYPCIEVLLVRVQYMNTKRTEHSTRTTFLRCALTDKFVRPIKACFS